MRILQVLGEAFQLLITEPLLFVPKLISTTMYIPPYLWYLQNSKIALDTQVLPESYMLSFGLLIVLSPVWWYLDAMYPFMVKQRREGKLDILESAKQVAPKFVRLAIFIILSTAAIMLATVPFAYLATLGYAEANLIYLIIGSIGMLGAILITGYVFYYAPTTLLLDEKGVKDALKTGFAISKENSTNTWLLTIFTLFFTVLIMLVGGWAEQIAVVGFVLGRYLGALLTVYLYIVNPIAYLEAKKSA